MEVQASLNSALHRLFNNHGVVQNNSFFSLQNDFCQMEDFSTKELLMKAQNLTEEAADSNIERFLEPAGDGLFRFTYDQRMKSLFTLPITSETLRQMYTMTKVPTLAILAQEQLDLGAYDRVPFVMDETAWPHGNYRFKVVPGNHDVHANDPGCMAEDISMFLLEGARSKL